MPRLVANDEGDLGSSLAHFFERLGVIGGEGGRGRIGAGVEVLFEDDLVDVAIGGKTTRLIDHIARIEGLAERPLLLRAG